MLTVYIVVNVILVNKEYYSEYIIFAYIYHLQFLVDVKLNLRPKGHKQERVYIYG